MDGSEPPNTDLQVSEHGTCGEYSAYAKQVSSDSTACGDIKAAAGMCGCPGESGSESAPPCVPVAPVVILQSTFLDSTRCFSQ